ncbi:MAG: glycosyltransferase [Niabella sp.]
MREKIIFTVSTDPLFDQRMQRICGSLAQNGYEVVLLGLDHRTGKPLMTQPYRQIRMRCFLRTGKLFFLELNIRLFFFLLFFKTDAICSIDLETIVPGLLVSKIRGLKRIYDAHELFTETKEVKRRPRIEKIWKWLERHTVPHFKDGYTVCESIARVFYQNYGVRYGVIRNVPRAKPLPDDSQKEKTFIYTGVVNEGRGFKELMSAMRYVRYKLIICGDGYIMHLVKQWIEEYGVQEKIVLKGMLSPDELQKEVEKAYIGINLVENEGLNMYYSLPNKFFDYIQMALPQVTMDYPEYQKINAEFDIAVLIGSLNEKELAAAMNNLMDDTVLYERLKKNCLRARQVLTWENEQAQLLRFYERLFNQ